MAVERGTYTLEEAATVLGVGRTLAYRLAREGNFPGLIRIGRRYLVSRSALDQFLGVPRSLIDIQGHGDGDDR